jgi:hypothetical protein
MVAIVDSNVSGRVTSAQKSLTVDAPFAVAIASAAAALFFLEREINARSNPQLANFAANARPRPSPKPTMIHKGFDMTSSLDSDHFYATPLRQSA